MMTADSHWRLIAMLRGWGAVALGYSLAGLTTVLFATNLHIMRESWLDRMVSFDPTAIWLYLSFFLLIALAFFVGPRGRIERLVRAMQICACVACCVFVIFPTSLEYPSFTGNGVSLAVLRALSWLDVRTNCLPSLHAALTTASLLTLWSKRKLFRTILVTLWALAICVSIVQLRRHLAIDVMAGATLGAASYVIAWLTPGSHRRKPKPDQALKQQDSLSFATATHRFKNDLRRAATRYLSMSGKDRFGDIPASVKDGALFALLMVCFFGRRSLVLRGWPSTSNFIYCSAKRSKRPERTVSGH
jgi:membrane-associated phospholipid phosphatase